MLASTSASSIRFVYFFTLGLLVGSLACGPQVQAADTSSPVHLVGHEEAELLRRVQDLIDDWDPRKLTNPLVRDSESKDVTVRASSGPIVARRQLRRPDLAEFIADVEAAEVLGKALFWEIQAGSDFRRLADGRFVGTACASCHYRNGADARSRHTTRIPFVVWDKYSLDPAHPLAFGEKRLPFDVKRSAVSEVRFEENSPYGNLSFTVGSAGVEPRRFKKLAPPPPAGMNGPWESEISEKRTLEDFQTYGQGYRPQWSMFVANQDDAGARFRQITERNSPTVINAAFANRLFHDGRAESTFNGFSIFGDRDRRSVLYRGVPKRDAEGAIVLNPQGSPVYDHPVSVHIAITNAALASQAVGPILSDMEMSYVGRTFPNVARKLLDAKVLPHQSISDDDSLLGPWVRDQRIGPRGKLNYRQLIQAAFRREWWDGGRDAMGREHTVPLTLMGDEPEDRAARGSIMEANFSLYWGLSIMLYEATLVSNHAPFDEMMKGNPKLVNDRWEREKARLAPIRLDRSPNFNDPEHTTGTAVFQHGFRVFLNRGCIECHSGPLFSEVYDRLPEAEPFPIQYTLDRILLPNSRSDFLGMNRNAMRKDMLARIAAIVDQASSLDAGKAARFAEQLDLLREIARGDEDELRQLVAARLRSIKVTSKTKTNAIASLLMTFEKQAHRSYGGRTFFTEDERVAMAELLVDPVLVEKMVIPESRPDRPFDRPPLPIQGPLAKDRYAFYDLGFYALGVSPPRYDRGNGGREFEPLVLEQIIESTRRGITAELEALPDTEKSGRDGAALRSQLQTLESLNTPDKVKARIQTATEAVAPPTDDALESLDSRIRRATGQAARQQANSGASGSAYRFPAQTRERTTPASVRPRGLDEGPAHDPDADWKLTEKYPDTSWDRSDIPQDMRRSSLIFKSRARTLVSDEEPWGFRKPFLHDNELAFWGAFKTPTLRNVELTAPYMHNGRLKSLADVIEFYDDGGFLLQDAVNNPDKHPAIKPLDMSGYDRLALEFFLLCLTDERVRLEQAPFDHPALPLVHGYDNEFRERVFEAPHVGRRGWTDDQGKPIPASIPRPFPHVQ
jgi:hypothetical protein